MVAFSRRGAIAALALIASLGVLPHAASPAFAQEGKTMTTSSGLTAPFPEIGR